MNTKGIKFLAVLAVLAMAFAACAVIANADESVATGEPTSEKWTAAGGAATMGPLDFATTGFTYETLGFDNEDLSNAIVVAYDVETKTYTVTGTLGWNANSDAKTDVLRALGMPTTDNYALAFLAVKGAGDFQVKVGTGALSPVKTANEDCILSMNKAGTSTVTIVGGEFEGTYNIDFSGVALSPSADKNPEVPFVGLKAYNEYVDINVYGSYGPTATNNGLGNSVVITEVDKTSADLYAEYTIYAKLAYNDFSVDAKGMDYHGTDFRYAVIWQIKGLECFDNNLGVSIPDGMGWNTGDDKDWYHAVASEMEGSQETFAFYYKDTDSISPGTVYLYFGPEAMPTKADVSNAACIKINFEIEQIKEDQIVADAEAAKTAFETKDEVELIVGNVDVPLGTDLVVKSDKIFVISANGDGKVSGDITVGEGTDAQKITLTNFKGTVEITKGSIVILANPWIEGTITLHNGDVVKLFGEIADDVTFAYGDASGSAKIIVEADTVLDIALGASLTVNNSKIAVEIEGTVEGLGLLDVTAAKSLTVKDGAVLSTVVESVMGAEKNVVYSGADINDAGIDAADIIYWIGKDAASGTWTYKDDTLTLNNYNGTYNFGVIPDDIEKIELNGINAVTVKAPVERTVEVEVDVDMYTLFGGLALTSITTDGAGSLAVIVDISDVKGEDLADPSAVILGEDLKINGVTISIFVDGSNVAWTDEQKEELSIAGIFATDGLDFFDAPTMVKVMPDYDYDGLIGIASLGDLNITGKSMLIEAATAIAACELTTIKTATVDVKGDVVLLDFGFGDVPVGFNDLTISNISDLTIDGALVAADVTISQESKITVKDALIAGDMSNKGEVVFNGDVMVIGSIENNATMENNGFIGVYGAFTNDVAATTAPSVFTNNGTVKVFAMEQNVVAEELVTEATLVINDATAPTAGNAKLKSIAITDALMQFDGTIKFNATIQVYNPAGEVVDVTDEFEGVVTPGFNGYEMSLHSNSASITIEYDSTSTEPLKVGKGYKISVTGSVSIWEQSLYLQANTTTAGSEATITTDTVKEGGLFTTSEAIFNIAAGTIDNNNHITVYVSEFDEIIEENATFNGNLTTYLDDVTISGTFNGDLHAAGEGTATVANFNGNIHSHGSVEVSASKTMTGDIIAKNNVTINGNLVGNILASGNVAVVNMIGKITVDRPNADADPKTVTLDGAVMVEIVYISNYKESTTATEPTMFTAVMDVMGTPNDLIIDLAKGSDATASAEAVPGFFKINNTGELGDNKTVDMALTEGRILVDSVKTLEARYYLTIEAGATIEVNKSAASLDVKKAALKVSKDANALFEVGPGTSVNYGKVYFVMAFEIENGAYTIYSDVAYALLNCEENTELYVGESATIDQDVIVKKGVNIVVEDITLTFNGKDVEMLEGAMITLEGTGKVVFKPTQTNYESIKEGEEITYYTVSATIVYGDNSIVFDEARFFMDDSTIQGVAATASADAKIKTDFQLIAGMATVSGLGTGSVKLFNNLYDETKSDDSETFCVFGTFVVAADAVFDAVKLEDSAAMVKYKDTDDGPEVKEIVMNSTIVGVEGTLNLLNDTTVLGGYVGFGHVTIAANNTLTVDKGALPDAFDVALNYPGSLNTYVVDTTDDANGYLFNFTSPVAGLADLVLKAEKLTIGGEKVDAVTISGLVASNSIIKAVDDAFLNGLMLDEGSIIYGEDVYIVVNDSSTLAGGSVGAKNIHMGEAPFKDLFYQTVFEEDGYYIYTMFDSIDWDEVSDVVIADDVVVDKLDLSGKDVNIVITEDATLTVTKLLIIGTPATVLGDEGSSIIGKVVIDSEMGYKAYIVAYADANLLLAEIVGADGDDAVFSKLDIEDVVYATIFADADDELVLAKADASLIPAIVGYNFTAWLNYNGDAKAEVGETNAYADARAVYLTVIVKYVAGVDYYMNGSLFNVYDIPTDVPYGTYFTAKISDTTKYQGNPLINGEKTVCVYDDMELVASGVTPIPEPAPEPVVGDSGLSLTDILLIVLVILIAIMVVILVLRLNRS